MNECPTRGIGIVRDLTMYNDVEATDVGIYAVIDKALVKARGLGL
jgi:hypothetical protein